MKNKNRQNHLKAYSRRIVKLMSGMDYDAIDAVIDCFLKARQRDSTIFFTGNGGSAATASHFAQDLAEIGRKTGVKSFRTISLSDNMSFITALANDYGYENIFKGQLSNLFKRNDVLVAISASGNSANILEAVKLANKAGGVTIGFVGFDGGKLVKLCDYVIHAVTDKGEYGLVEDVHLILNHMISDYLMSSGMRKRNRK